jgi:hypothetical protein
MDHGHLGIGIGIRITLGVGGGCVLSAVNSLSLFNT